MRLAERPHDLKLTVPLVGAELIGVETPVGIPQAERLLAPEVVDADAHACAASHRGAPVSSVNVVALYNPVGLGFSGGASNSMARALWSLWCPLKYRCPAEPTRRGPVR